MTEAKRKGRERKGKVKRSEKEDIIQSKEVMLVIIHKML